MDPETITVAEAVGRQVRAALVECGLRQGCLVGMLGISHNAVSRRMTGQVSFTAVDLITIGQGIGVDPARFLTPIPQQRTAAPAATTAQAVA